MAISTSWVLAMESSTIRFSGTTWMRSPSSSSRVRRFSSFVSTRPYQVSGSRPRKMFSATVICGMGESSWWIIEIPMASASCVSVMVTGRPSSSMVPSSGAYMPMRHFMSVDFPAPFSPMSACTVPLRTWSWTRSSACTPGNRLEMPCMRRTKSLMCGLLGSAAHPAAARWAACGGPAPTS